MIPKGTRVSWRLPYELRQFGTVVTTSDSGRTVYVRGPGGKLTPVPRNLITHESG